MTTFISRRDLLKRAGFAGAAAFVAPAFVPHDATAGGQALAARPASRVFENLTAPESEVLEAIVARLIPTDETGPGALEAGAAHYIDRGLGGALRTSRTAYQAGLKALDEYARTSRGKPFAQLAAA